MEKQYISTKLRVENSDQIISIYRDNESFPLITQNAIKDKKPFIHPIAAPDGKGILTEDSPSHHPWQHGVYCGSNNINGVGFWEEGIRGGHDGTFHTRPFSQPVVNGNKVVWKLETDWRGPDGTHMVTEVQEWTFNDLGLTYELDLVWILKAEIPLTFAKHMCGGLFLRMPFKEELGGKAINSIGQENDDAETKRANWVAVNMPIEGRQDWAGIAIMDHVDNPDHPVTWRVDHQLGVSPSRCIAGDWTLQQGKVEQFKYRLFVYCGETNIEQIEENWNAFNGKNSY
jgi:hypothetical protein